MENKEESKYTLVEVPTQMGLAFKNPEGIILSEPELLIELANKVEEVRKTLQ